MKNIYKVARYTVIFERAIGEEDGQGLELHDGTPLGATKQLAKEIQAGFDSGDLSGCFSIVKREVINATEPTCFDLPVDYQ